MAVKKSIAAQLADFAPEQPDGSITPDRVQSVIVSARPGFGRLSLATDVETSITAVNTWTKLAGVTELGEGAITFSMPENNRLQCNCPVGSRLEAEAIVTLNNGSQKTFEVAFAKGNGADPVEILAHSVQAVRFGPGGDTLEAVLKCDFVQAQGDFVEIWVRNVTDSTNVTAKAIYCKAHTFTL
jgi:hypothetical protein